MMRLGAIEVPVARRSLDDMRNRILIHATICVIILVLR